MAEAMKFGQEEFAVSLPPELIAAELEPNRVELPRRTPAEHIRWALDHPVDSAPLKEIVKPGETVCVIISDVTRRWQSPETYIPSLVADETGVGLHIAGHPGALPVGAVAYRPTGACGRRPWLAFIAAAPLFKAAGLRPATRSLL